MKKRKSFLQKTSGIIGIVCFFLAALSAVVLYFKVKELGMEDTISASLLASAFFFTFVGFVFTIIGNANIPSFKVVAAAPASQDKEDERS